MMADESGYKVVYDGPQINRYQPCGCEVVGAVSLKQLDTCPACRRHVTGLVMGPSLMLQGPVMRDCAECGNAFEPKYEGNNTCSTACWKRQTTRIESEFFAQMRIDKAPATHEDIETVLAALKRLEAKVDALERA